MPLDRLRRCYSTPISAPLTDRVHTKAHRLAMGRAEQKAPNRSQDVRHVLITHPHHPLAGQIVKVLRQTRHPSDPERRWIIELADGSAAGIPLSWAVPVYDTIDPPAGPVQARADGL